MKQKLNRLIEIGFLPSDDAALRLKKVALTLLPLIIGAAALVWGAIFFLLGRPLAGAIPMAYWVLSVGALVYYLKTKKTAFLEYGQLLLVLVLPFLLMWSLGGFSGGSVVMIWALFAPVSALMFSEKRVALRWLLAFFILLLISGMIDDTVASAAVPLPRLARDIFYVLNLGCASAGLFLLVSYSINVEKRAIEELERAQKEVLAAKENLELRVRDRTAELQDSEEKLLQSAEHIRQLAFYDPLTNLPNRRMLLDRLEIALTTDERSGQKGGLIFLDLDNFKKLNDSLGHDYGDLLLKEVAQRITTCVRGGDTVARLGGDEFIVMLNDLGVESGEAALKADVVSKKILEALNQPYVLRNYTTHSTPSIGVTLFGGDGDTLEDVLKRADLAMYQAKTAGRNAIRFFDPELQAITAARDELEVELSAGLHKGHLMLYYQAQVDASGGVTGAEALARWRHPERGMISPAEFIPLAEHTGLIVPLGRRVLEIACKQLKNWSTRPETAHLTLSVNISTRQFLDPNFLEQFVKILDQTGADPRKLKMEVTESLLLDNVDSVVATMTKLKGLGVSFAIDDFGTGYSSLSYLKRLPLDQLKIDQTFVRDMLFDKNDSAIIRTIVALAQSLGLAVIAEGVETEEQLASLAEHGCGAYQGYLFCRPLPIEDFEEKLVQGRNSAKSP